MSRQDLHVRTQESSVCSQRTCAMGHTVCASLSCACLLIFSLGCGAVFLNSESFLIRSFKEMTV